MGIQLPQVAPGTSNLTHSRPGTRSITHRGPEGHRQPAWPPNAIMGSGGAVASAGGHVAYVESVQDLNTIVISQMGVGGKPPGGYTDSLVYDHAQSYFIH